MTQRMNVVSQLQEHGEDIPNQKVVETMLKSLPWKNDMVVTILEKWKYWRQLSI